MYVWCKLCLCGACYVCVVHVMSVWCMLMLCCYNNQPIAGSRIGVQEKQNTSIDIPCPVVMVFVDHTRNICRQELQANEKQHLEEERQIPHFSNLNEDPALNGKLIHLAKAGLYQTYIYSLNGLMGRHLGYAAITDPHQSIG